MSDIVIGMGQVGQAVQAVINAEYSYDASGDPFNVLDYSEIEVMHICFPPIDDFEDQVRNYAAALKPKHILVWSTVPIGTCAKIDARIVHTPVEGVHPHLEPSIRIMRRWLGANDAKEAEFFVEYFTTLGIMTKVVSSTDFTEALKLLSTAEYGANLVFADYKKLVAQGIGMPYELTRKWNQDYNALYKDLGLRKYQKFVLDPPNGTIGGHCVRPNAVILDRQYPYEILKTIVKMGELE